MAEFDIDSFVNVPELTKQFNALDARVEQSAEKMSQLIGKMGSLGMGTDYSKIAGDLAAANTKLLALEQQVMAQKAQKIKLSVEERTELQALNAVQKLNAIIAAENTTALQKLGAQIKLNVIDSQKYVAAGDTQNKTYLGLIQSTTKLSGEYDRMAKASGANAVKTNSMYGSTFQLTQVMRELPNFAIDARIGFMALSNNLPMLAEGFKSVMLEIDTITGKKKGFVGALKEFGSSLLSLNTIMIVLTTVMVLWGDDLVELFTGKIPVAERAMASFLKELRSGNGEFNTANKKFQEMAAIVEASSKGFISHKDAIEEYNSAFGKTNGTVETFAELQNRIQEQSPAYVQAMGMMSLANAYLEESIKDAGEAEALRADKTVKWYDNILGVFKNFNRTGMLTLEGGSDKNVIAMRMKDASDKIKDSTEAFDKYKKKYSEFAAFAEKNKIDIWGDDNDPKTSAAKKAQKTFTEINVLRVMYDKQHADLVEKAAQLEQDISKSNLDGELNSYDKRTAAAELYYKIISELSEKDRSIAIANENAKMAKEKESLRIKHENNVNKFGAGSAEAAKSASDLAEGNNVLFLNNADARQKIIDDFTKKELDAARKKQADLRKINEDMYADEVYLLEQAKKKEAAALGISSTKQKAKTGARTTSELINSKLGGSSDNKLQEIEDDRNAKNEQLAIDRKYIEDELALKNISGEKKKELQRKWDENLASAVQNDREANTQNEIELAQMAEDAKASIISDSIDTLKSLWDSYYQYQQDKIDETLKKQTAVNEESVKQYQDETDAGMHTAKQMSDYKDRIAAYQASQDDAAAEKKKQLEKEQFLTKQAFAVGEVWINYAINVAKAGVNAVAQGWLLGSAIASTALIAAQTIPAFAEGGTMGKDGKAWIGDGGKNELVMTPTGEWYVSPKVPTVVDMKAGTKIFPDINKLDLNSFLAMAQVRPSMLKTDNLEKEIRGLRSDVRNQKQGNFYGMPLIRQLNNSDRYSARRRGLMN